MSVSRRGFLQGLRVGQHAHAAAFMAARGHEELMAEAQQAGRQGGARSMRPNLPPGVEGIRISSNENPLGPGKAAIDAILGKFPEANRYPFNSTPLDADLEILIAKLNTAKRENVVLGVGSQELLKNAARVFLSPTKHLVIPSPTYGDPAGLRAERAQGARSRRRRSTRRRSRPILSALLPHVKGAGLVYLCNPNNPTATINSAQEIKDFIAEVKKPSPTTGDPDRRGVLRLRHRPGLRRRAIPIALVDAERPRRAHLLEGLRHGRRAHRLRASATRRPSRR